MTMRWYNTGKAVLRLVVAGGIVVVLWPAFRKRF